MPRIGQHAAYFSDPEVTPVIHKDPVTFEDVSFLVYKLGEVAPRFIRCDLCDQIVTLGGREGHRTWGAMDQVLHIQGSNCLPFPCHLGNHITWEGRGENRRGRGVSPTCPPGLLSHIHIFGLHQRPSDRTSRIHGRRRSSTQIVLSIDGTT